MDCKLPILYISHDETLIENTANVIVHMEHIIKKPNAVSPSHAPGTVSISIPKGKTVHLRGGQQAKILFLDMILKKADVLLLDEPTRNFSPLSCPVVRAALKEFGGAIINVSHDRKYLNEVAEKVYELRKDGLFPIQSCKAF